MLYRDQERYNTTPGVRSALTGVLYRDQEHYSVVPSLGSGVLYRDQEHYSTTPEVRSALTGVLYRDQEHYSIVPSLSALTLQGSGALQYSTIPECSDTTRIRSNIILILGSRVL